MEVHISTTIRLTPTLEEQIRERAYNLWLERGCPEGQELENWLMAKEYVLRSEEERIRLEQLGQPRETVSPFPNDHSLGAELCDPAPEFQIRRLPKNQFFEPV